MYGKLLTSREFQTQAEAMNFGKEIKGQYAQAEISIKMDVERTNSSTWKCNVWAKLD